MEHVRGRAAAGDEVDGDGLPRGIERLCHLEHHVRPHRVPEENRRLVQQGEDRLHLRQPRSAADSATQVSDSVSDRVSE